MTVLFASIRIIFAHFRLNQKFVDRHTNLHHIYLPKYYQNDLLALKGDGKV